MVFPFLHKFESKKVMKKKVIYQLILDRSGSMNDCVTETISGFNEQVQRIRQLEEQYPDQVVRVNLCLFNHNISHQRYLFA